MSDPKTKREPDGTKPDDPKRRPAPDDDRQITEASEGLPGYTDTP